MSCCPEGSLPALQADYKPRGEQIKVGDLDVYAVGSGSKAIIMAYDIYGFDPAVGRTRSIADQLADDGYLVVLPDFFRGNPWPVGKPFDTLSDWLKTMPFEPGLKTDVHETLLPYLKEQRGITSVGMVGFCWGAWLILRTAQTEGAVSCGVSFHPSMMPEALFGGTADDLARCVTCPQLFLPAGNDDGAVREGGSIMAILQSSANERVRQSVTHSFTDMKHGYASRGNVEFGDEILRRDVAGSYKMAVEFLGKHM